MTNSNAWIYLILAILTEVLATTSMKLSAGFTELKPSLLIFLFYGLSFGFLALSLKRLEIGFAYAVWSALGTFLIFFIGIGYFHEPFTILKTGSLICIIIGVLGLRSA